MTDSVRCKPKRAAPLAQLVHEKTKGNPFFAIQFISTLAEEGLLTFEHDCQFQKYLRMCSLMLSDSVMICQWAKLFTQLMRYRVQGISLLTQ